MNLKEDGIIIDTISTDRHTQIRKLLRTDPIFKDMIRKGHFKIDSLF